MKILWLINLPLPSISLALGQEPLFAGGWLVNLSELVCSQQELELIIVFPQNIKKKLVIGDIGKYRYYGFFSHFSAQKKYVKQLEESFIDIIQIEKPDLIHIFGTEYVHTYAMIRVLRSLNMTHMLLVTVQGLVSVCQRHYYTFLPIWVVYIPSIRDIMKRESIVRQKYLMKKRGNYEKQSIEEIWFATGRTEWDRACILQINPRLKYYHLNEVMRDGFYHRKWHGKNSKKETIFVSQAQYCLKGFHIVLEAVSILNRKYAHIEVRVAGTKQIRKPRWKFTSYENYINMLISKYRLEKNISYLGSKNEEEMGDEYENAAVFVCASGIENSSNSVCEAMLVGTPVVASDVGGMSSILTHGTEGFLYPADEPYMLAYYIDKLWENEGLAIEISENARKRAKVDHNPQKNVEELLAIYDAITDEGRHE